MPKTLKQMWLSLRLHTMTRLRLSKKLECLYLLPNNPIFCHSLIAFLYLGKYSKEVVRGYNS